MTKIAYYLLDPDDILQSGDVWRSLGQEVFKIPRIAIGKPARYYQGSSMIAMRPQVIENIRVPTTRKLEI